MKKKAVKDQDSIETFNVNKPGKSQRVQRDKYEDMKAGLLRLLPSIPPGLTQTEMMNSIPDYLSPTLFPNGEKAGWWLKSVQLDLEARNILIRENCSPLRWYKNNDGSSYREPIAENLPTPPRPTHKMPSYVKERIESAGLMRAYQERPYYQRNDYVGWILQAKREPTKEKRIAQMLEELASGDRYMNSEYTVKR